MRMTKDIADRAAKKMVQELHNKMIPKLKERDQIIVDLYTSYVKEHDMKFFLENPHLFQPIEGFMVIGNGISYNRHISLNDTEQKLPWFPYLKEAGIRQGEYNKPILNFNAMNGRGARKSVDYVHTYNNIENKKKEIKKVEDKIYNTLLSFTTVAKAIICFPEASSFLPTEKEPIVSNLPSITIQEIINDLKHLGNGNK